MIHTAQDVVDYLLSATGGGGQDGEHRAIRQAVIHGVREVLHARDWLWHTATGTFTAQQKSTTASAITSGSATMTVGSTADMFPGRLLDMSPTYFSRNPRVVSITNATTVVVDINAIATLSSGTTPILIQTYYDLPANLRDIDALVTNTVGTLHCYISPQQWQRLEINSRGASEPYYYTIMRSDKYPDRFQIRFVGIPTNSLIFNYTYRYQPKMVKYMGYEPLCRQGTITVGSTSTPQSVTGNGTAFQSDMVGSMLRMGTATNEAEPVGALRPFVAESKITAVGSTTGITCADGGLPTATTVKYAISDIIDCSPQMYTAVLSAAEMWYARLAGKPGADVVALFNRDLRLAMEQDVVSPMSGRPTSIGFPTPRSRGWYSAQQADQGT